MPAERVLEIEGLQSSPPYAAGLPTMIYAVGRASEHFERLRITVTLPLPGASPLFQGEVDVVYQNQPGTWSIAIDPASVSTVLSCDMQLLVEARAIQGSGVGDPDSVVWGIHAIKCKPAPAGPGGDGGDGDSWPPWLPPPHIACPNFGRTFAVLLLAGLVMLIFGIASANAGFLAAGAAALASAGATYWVWRFLCVPNDCYKWGAILWAAKRAIIAGVPISLLYLSANALLLVLALGAVAGGIVAYLRHRYCPIPSASTSLQNLPFW